MADEEEICLRPHFVGIELGGDWLLDRVRGVPEERRWEDEFLARLGPIAIYQVEFNRNFGRIFVTLMPRFDLAIGHDEEIWKHHDPTRPLHVASTLTG